MGSRNLSSSFSFAKDILKNATDKLNEFVDSALTTYEGSTGRKLKHGDDGIHLAGGSDFCMDIRRYDQVSPVSETEQTSVSEVEEIVEPTVVPEKIHIQEMEEVPAVQQTIVSEEVLIADDVVVDEIPSIGHEIVKVETLVADDTVAEDVPAIQDEMIIDETPVVEEQQFSEVECLKDGEVSYGVPTGKTGFDEEIAIQSVPEVAAQADTSTVVETMPSFHQFIDESAEPMEIDDGVDFEDLYEDLVAECIVDDIMPRFMAEERTFVPDYVISEIEQPSEASTVIDVPVIYVPEYVISEIASPTEEITQIDVPEPVVEAPSIVDSVTTTATFRFGFASTSMPGKTGFTFGIGKRSRVDEFINGPKD